MANFIVGIVSLVVGITLMTSLFLTTVHDTNTTGWSTGEIAIWSVLGLIGIVGILYGVLNVFGINL